MDKAMKNNVKWETFMKEATKDYGLRQGIEREKI